MQYLRKHLLFLCKLWNYLFYIALSCIISIILHNHTKTHTLLFCWCLKLIDIYRMVCADLLLFCISIFIFNRFPKTIFLNDSLVLIPNNYFLSTLLLVLCICVFFHFLYFSEKLNYSSTLKNIFPDQFLLLFLISYSCQCMSLARLFD